MITVAKAETFLSVAGDTRRVVDAIRELPGAEWDRGKSRWKIPLSLGIAEQLLDVLDGDSRVDPSEWGSVSGALSSVRDGAVVVDDRVWRWFEAAKARYERIYTVRGLVDPDLGIEFVPGFTPFKFQKKGALFLATAKRALLGDKMGLGKTLEAIMAVIILRHVGVMDAATDRILVVAPNKGREAWIKHIRWLCPDDHCAIIGVGKGLDNKLAPGWYVMNWEKVMHRTAKLVSIDWAAIVADESHRMKERKTGTAKAMHKIDSPIKFALSGTPIENRRQEFWSQLHWLDAGRFPSFWTFINMYIETELSKPWEGKKHRVFVGEKNDDLLVRELETVMMARDLDHPEVDMELPEVFQNDDPVRLGDRQWDVYCQMRDEFVAWLEGEDDAIVAKNWMTQALRLKQIAGSLAAFSDVHRDSAKIDRLMEKIEDNPDEKFVVMSQFRKAGVDPLCADLRRAGVVYCEMVGGNRNVAWSQGQGERDAGSPQRLMDYFNEHEAPRVFVATLQTGGESVTLTGARHFQFLDLLWAPTKNEQAWKRIHRGGQTRKCFVDRIMALDTIDYMVIDPMLTRKEDIIRRVMKPGEE